MKNEAIRRMHELDIFEPAIEMFEKDGTVMISEPPFGALYGLDDEQKEMVRKFEEESGGLVYLVIRTYAEFGTCDNLLFVSKYEEEWESEVKKADDPNKFYVFSYVVNHDCEWCSEYGTIGVKKVFGGLLRWC